MSNSVLSHLTRRDLEREVEVRGHRLALAEERLLEKEAENARLRAALETLLSVMVDD